MVFGALLRRYRRHLKHFHDDFDSIKDINIETEYQGSFVPANLSQPTSSGKVNIINKLHYLFGMLTILYVGVESVVVIAQDETVLRHNWTAVTSIEQLFPHRIFPRTFWKQADITASICLGMAVVLYAILSWRPPLPPSSCLYAYTDQQTGEVLCLVDFTGEGSRRFLKRKNFVSNMFFLLEIPPELAAKIVHFRGSARRSVSALMSVVLAFLVAYFGQQVYWRSLYSSPTALFFYFIYMPLMLSYAVLGKAGALF